MAVMLHAIGERSAGPLMAKQYGLIDGEAARRHHALAGRKLAVSVQPMPGEGAADLILRASALNAYHYPFEIMKIIGGKREQRFSHYGVAKWGLTLDGLGDLLGTRKGQSDIAPLLYPSTGRDSFDFFSSNLPYHQLIGHRRVAPTFLKYGGYQKAIWHIKSLTFDPSTFETLLDKCPVCRARLTFVSTKGICSCHKCFDPNDRRKASVDLRDYPQPIVEFDDEEAVRFVTDLIDPERVDRGRAALHPELREFNPGHLFEFIVQAAKALDFKTGVCRALQSNFSAVGEVSAKNLSVAGRAMINWPHGFIEMAESLKNVWFFPQTKDFYAHPLRVRLMSPFYDPRFRKLMTSGIKSSLRASVLIAVDGTTKTTPSTTPQRL
ncbi:hypothetical protein BA011_09715 [Rhizobium leguminosarum]|uniref:TniQ family protein n=2 Tax=Rhizobium leguminosarum TaxID=384 RepID=A0A1B1C8C1_RHILE|nr:hypothetical protein BA011_09715 [Rhizobium leguminosarum]